jgi:5-methylcytosine-specific restriction endonuclease McrA
VLTPEQREQRQAYMRAWYEKNPEYNATVGREVRRKSRLANRHKEQARRANWRANKLGIPGRITGQDILDRFQYQDGVCEYCPELLGTTYHVDHFQPFDLNGWNTADNIRLSCPGCNMRKGRKPPEEFLSRLSCEEVMPC